MEEIWKDVLGYEGLYQVSNLGKVKSLNKSKILKPGKTPYGHLFVNLYKEKKAKSRTVHQLVAVAFLNHKPCRFEAVIDHVDNNRTNNIVSNLQITTQRANLSKSNKEKTSKYIGVIWHKSSKKWRSSIRIGSSRKYLGYFENEFDAHLAYQKELNLINGCK